MIKIGNETFRLKTITIEEKLESLKDFTDQPNPDRDLVKPTPCKTVLPTGADHESHESEVEINSNTSENEDANDASDEHSDSNINPEPTTEVGTYFHPSFLS